MIRNMCLAAAIWLAAIPAAAAEFITVASTTSTENSGLLSEILPKFTEKTGIEVRVVAVGTGQALRIARNGDADLLLVHHRPSEDAFVAEGYGLERRDVMYNDFVLIGPGDDPAGISGAGDVSEALVRIAEAEAPFLSRGDDSGTHKKELELWAEAGVTLPDGGWYLETGSGMGATLNIGVATGAYVLTDRGTWITFGNKRDNELLFSGDPRLFNPYGVIVVNPERFPHAKVEAAQALSDWLVSAEGQAAIGAFQIEGLQAFCPNSPEKAGRREQEEERCPADR
ncbi:substrate-binding domain-containing protein [Oceanibium sediminis]|uniref:substrate-binding domain-containing protein n=1 Tax=Oceanibium sediminis TaxID=2026339 RepID=UPI000DD39A46|nr:substrate-binding domain-containing protein [Oceanibium sediminis]